MTPARQNKRTRKRRPPAKRTRTKPTLAERFNALQVEPMPPIGIRTSAVIRDVIFHVQARVLVHPKEGVIYGRHGKPLGRIYSDGYVRVSTGETLHQYAHRIIWSAVHGEIGEGFQIDHLNGIKHDNRILNLDRATHRQNVQRSRLFGLAPCGEQMQNAKLTAALVRAIRSTRGKKSCAQWAREIGVHPATVRSAREGKSWAHVGAPNRRAKRQRNSGRKNGKAT